MAEFELITAYEALHGFVSRIGHEQVIALDTEASSFHRYKESVCLVQISTREHTFLVDPLAVTDLTDLGDVLVKTHMEVVIHDADYDLRILAKHHGIRVENVFDTLVAAETTPICGNRNRIFQIQLCNLKHSAMFITKLFGYGQPI